MRHLASRRELFLDRALIERLDGCALKLHEPRDEGPVFPFDKPWDGMFSCYATVLRDVDRYRLYYRGKREFEEDGVGETVCLAESADGIHWVRPELGLVAFGGDARNNILLHDRVLCHNFSPFLDRNPAVSAGARYKAWSGSLFNNPRGGLMALSSPDGIHWAKMREEPVLAAGALDSQNVAFWSETENEYLAFFRAFTRRNPTPREWKPEGLRTVYRARSRSFLDWGDVRPMAFDPPQTEEYYTNQTQPYFRAPHLLLSTAVRFTPGRDALGAAALERLGVHPKYAAVARDTSDVVLMSSRDGFRYDRTFPEAWIRPGASKRAWVSRCNYPALNLVPTGAREMSLYLNAEYAQPTAHLRRYALRLDGFASLHAGHEGGEMTTRPFTFTGDRLFFNGATSGAGAIRVEIQDDRGLPIPGFALDDCEEYFGDDIEAPVHWKGEPRLAAINGAAVRLRFQLREADVFSFQFRTEGARSP